VAGEVDKDERFTDFVTALGRVVGASELSTPEKTATIRAFADVIEGIGGLPRCTTVPFLPGRRPTDEASHPGTGASDAAMVRLGTADRSNTSTVLFGLSDLPDDAEVTATIRLEPTHRSDRPTVLDGWDSRPLTIEPEGARYHLDVPAEAALDAADLGFDHGYLRCARVQVRVDREGLPLAADEVQLDVCDMSELGRLYERIIDRVLVPDTARQARAASAPDPGVAYHPWFPVLNIGGDKAALYSEALVSDIVDKTHHLSDPAWLLRVGVYLELLTCIGIAEAVRDDVGDILDPSERDALETRDVYAEIRQRVNPAAWREVWKLRRIVFSRLGMPRTGPVSAGNLLAKRRATLAFLHAHHEDLKHAIELAGRNHHNSQETWHRVFRDAERAVLRQTTSSFPELGFLPPPMRERVLWQRHGFADQQGLYATACVQYRASMNHVAEWARDVGMMDYTGTECVPIETSLLEAHTRTPDRVAALQRGDGYGPSLELTPLEGEPAPTTDEIEELIGASPMFSMLEPDDLQELVQAARPLLLAPGARFIRHGDPGSSLFLVGHGEVEVLLRTATGEDIFIESIHSGSIVGEMSFLTGAPRAATVRAGSEGAVVFEIERAVFDALAASHPEWEAQLGELMEQRLTRRAGILRERFSRTAVRERIRGVLALRR